VDELGKPSLDYDKFWDYINTREKERRLATQVAQGKKKANKKF
jgi:hypothetical protein